MDLGTSSSAGIPLAATPSASLNFPSPNVQGGSGSLQGGGLSVQGAGGGSIQGGGNPIQAAINNVQVPATTAQSVAASQQGINQAQTQANSETATIANLLKSIQAEEQANAPGNPISINTNALQAQANASAQNTVNPLYTQYLNQYLQTLGAAAGSSDTGTLQNAINAYNPNSLTYNTGLNGSAEQQSALNIASEQSSLQNTLAQNLNSENAASQTNALTQGNINTQQQNYQLTTGNAQNAKLQAIGQSIGSGNLGGSGLGQQQIYEAENTRNVADAAQSGQFQYDRNTSNLSTQDTFAQLAQSSAYATTGEGEQQQQTNFNLNDYLRQAAANDTATQESLAQSQQNALTAQEQNNLAGLTNNAITSSGVSGKNLVATQGAYASDLQTATPVSYDISSALNNIPSVGAGV
jgi:hypothetical protein